MSEPVEIRVPDIGDFTDVEVIEVHVAAGDSVQPEDPLITLETDKAAMEVPAPRAGRVAGLRVAAGDRVSEGSIILLLEADESAGADARQAQGGTKGGGAAAGEGAGAAPGEAATAGQAGAGKAGDASAGVAAGAAASREAGGGASPAAAARYSGDVDLKTGLVALGAGVGGYAAAIRAAALGRETLLVDRWPTLGGVCLNVGCIPSKALLHAARLIDDAERMADHGIVFGKPRIEPDRLREWKDQVIGRLTGGLSTMAKQRKVDVMQGTAKFVSPHHLQVSTADGPRIVQFEQCVIAAGSEPARLPFQPDDPRVLDSTSALELAVLPERMLVIGGGIIGLEMATVYHALGVRMSIVELTDTLVPEADRDLVRPYHKHIAARYEQILLGTKVTGMEAREEGIAVTLEGGDGERTEVYGAVLVSIGRRPNGDRIGAEAAGVKVERGFIPVDRHMRTNVEHIHAVGDIVGQPMLAHKGTHQGVVAAEVASGHRRAFDARVIPSVAYTDPEIAWVGLTEAEAKKNGVDYGKGVFPWAASGRSLGMNRSEGLTKLLFDRETGRVVGAGMVGPHAGDLVSECALAIEMGCDAEDIGLTIHPHPTLSETVMNAAEVYEGIAIDLYAPKRRGGRPG